MSTVEEVDITLYVIAERTVTSRNVPTRDLEYRDAIPEWLPPDEYVEDCIRQTCGSEGTGLAVLWKGEFEVSDGFQKVLDRIMSNPFPENANIYLTRFEARMPPRAMTEDIELAEQWIRRSVQVEIYTHAALNEPMMIRGLSGVAALAVGDGHYLALKDDGTVWAWGWW